MKKHLAELLSAVPVILNPIGPHKFHSGKFTNKSAEIVMLICYDRLFRQFQKMIASREVKTQYFNHLAWLMRQGENRMAKEHCQWCEHDSPVTEFFVNGNPREGYSINKDYACCGRQECEERVREESDWEGGVFFPACFSSISAFKTKTDRSKITELLRYLFKLNHRVTSEELFRFFAEHPNP